MKSSRIYINSIVSLPLKLTKITDFIIDWVAYNLQNICKKIRTYYIKVVGFKPVGLNHLKKTLFFWFKWIFLDLSYFRLHTRVKTASSSRKCTFKWYKALNIHFNPPSDPLLTHDSFAKICFILDKREPTPEFLTVLPAEWIGLHWSCLSFI